MVIFLEGGDLDFASSFFFFFFFAMAKYLNLKFITWRVFPR